MSAMRLISWRFFHSHQLHIHLQQIRNIVIKVVVISKHQNFLKEITIMAKKEKRFEVIYKDGSQLADEGYRQILVDKETGVNYLSWKSGYGAGITPLLDSDGKVIVTK